MIELLFFIGALLGAILIGAFIEHRRDQNCRRAFRAYIEERRLKFCQPQF